MKEETTSTKAETKKFDGYVDIYEPQMDGTYTKRNEKFYLSDDEVKEFMGANDPKDYWRLGRVPNIYEKEFGSLLTDSNIEKQVCDKVFAKFPGVIIFRHKLQPLYTLLIPKTYSNLEKDTEGEYSNRLIFCDSRSVVFGSQDGGSFTEKNFIKKAQKILKHLAKTNSDDYLAE